MKSDSAELDGLVERIAEAVVERLEERRKIQAIADYVLAELEQRGMTQQPATSSGPAENSRATTAEPDN